MLVVLKEDYTIPAGKVMRVYSGIGPVSEAQAVCKAEVGGPIADTNFDLNYVVGSPDLFEIIHEEFDPELSVLLGEKSN